MAEQIIQVIDALCSKFGIAIDWSAENVIPYITELSSRYANYVILSNIIYLVIYAILVFAGIKFVTMPKEGFLDSDEGEILMIVLGLFYIGIMIVFTICAIFIIPEIIKAITMPEFLLIEKIMSYLN